LARGIKETNDSLICSTQEQSPEPIFGKGNQKFQTAGTIEMDRESDMSVHLLSSSSLSNTEMERELVYKWVFQALLQEDLKTMEYLLEMLCTGRYL